MNRILLWLINLLLFEIDQNLFTFYNITFFIKIRLLYCFAFFKITVIELFIIYLWLFWRNVTFTFKNIDLFSFVPRKEESFVCQGFHLKKTPSSNWSAMSKYGYTGGVKRRIDDSMKQDLEGPSIDDLNRYFKVILYRTHT
jgi:hypothetical protein